MGFEALVEQLGEEWALRESGYTALTQASPTAR